MRALDVEAVQAFVLTADLKSFTRAAEVLDTTQSAVSLKIKRLESGLGRRLLERTPRVVRLSADGQAFLGPARQLVAAHHGAIGSFGIERRRLIVGISQHIVGSELPMLLRRMSEAEPALVLEMRVATSNESLDQLDSGAIDAALVLSHDNRRSGGETILEESFGWMAAPDFEHCVGEPLRLATQAEPCSVRSMSIDALKQAGIAWTEVFVGGGIATTGAAVSAGLAVAALAHRVAPPGIIDVRKTFGLPTLPSRDIVLYSSVSDANTKSSLKTLAAAIRATAG